MKYDEDGILNESNIPETDFTNKFVKGKDNRYIVIGYATKHGGRIKVSARRATINANNKSDYVSIYVANEKNKDVRIEEGALIYDKSNKSLGRAYIVSTKGYSTQNNITMSIGFDENNVITSLEIVSMNETAGLGANCTSDEFKGQFKGKSNELGVSRSKTPGDDEISAISGATITSKAVTAGVNECIKLNQSIL